MNTFQDHGVLSVDVFLVYFSLIMKLYYLLFLLVHLHD